jgi:pimeloyl-ACP methyl ester carboxylesterase
MVTEKCFQADGVALNFAEGPPGGAPLVLLHGITGWWQDFLSIMPLLAFRYHLYALDFRGHGRSGRVPCRYRLEDYSRDTIAFLRQQVGEPAVLLGHSLGGMVAVQVAAQAPDTVRALVLEDPPLFAVRGERLRARAYYPMFIACRDLAQTEFSLEAWLPELARLWPEGNLVELRAWAKSLSRMDAEVLSHYVDGRLSENYYIDELLAQVGCPVLLLRGDPGIDGIITDEDARRATTLLKQCVLVSVPGVGHLIHAPQPEFFRRTVTDFLESL